MFVCQSCGSVQSKWAGQCAGCGAWNTLVEEVSSRPPGALAPIATAPKEGFETTIHATAAGPDVAVAALGSAGQTLATSAPVPIA